MAAGARRRLRTPIGVLQRPEGLLLVALAAAGAAASAVGWLPWWAAVLAVLVSAVGVMTRDRLLEVSDAVAESSEQGTALASLAPLAARFKSLAPPVGGWAMTAGSLNALVRLVERRGVCRVVELGPGSSTLFLAMLARTAGLPLEVIAVEHDEPYAADLRNRLQREGLSGVEVRVAPLAEQRVGSWSGRWYDPAALQGIEGVDLLVVDGPPGILQAESRFPAVPVLLGSLTRDAVVFVDDFNRRDEQRLVDRWLADTPGLSIVERGRRYCVLAYAPSA